MGRPRHRSRISSPGDSFELVGATAGSPRESPNHRNPPPPSCHAAAAELPCPGWLHPSRLSGSRGPGIKLAGVARPVPAATACTGVDEAVGILLSRDAPESRLLGTAIAGADASRPPFPCPPPALVHGQIPATSCGSVSRPTARCCGCFPASGTASPAARAAGTSSGRTCAPPPRAGGVARSSRCGCGEGLGTSPGRGLAGFRPVPWCCLGGESPSAGSEGGFVRGA